MSKNSKLETGLAGSSEGIYQVPDRHNHTHFIKIIMKLIRKVLVPVLFRIVNKNSPEISEASYVFCCFLHEWSKSNMGQEQPVLLFAGPRRARV